MANSIKKSILGLMKKINKKRFQLFFENLYILSLHGMGFGESELDKDGEADILRKLGKKKEKLVIFDVGANIGRYTQECKKFIPDSEVYCFEPSKKTFETLKDNLKNFKKVYLHNIGFGERKSKKNLFYDREGSSLASVYNRKLDYRKIYFNKKEKINIETIDSFCKKELIREISLLKIDVEGNELNVLKGAKEMIRKRGIKKIQFEFGGCNIDSRVFFRDFWNMLNKNYTIYRIIKGGLVQIKNYKELNEIFTLINYFAVLKDAESF